MSVRGDMVESNLRTQANQCIDPPMSLVEHWIKAADSKSGILLVGHFPPKSIAGVRHVCEELAERLPVGDSRVVTTSRNRMSPMQAKAVTNISYYCQGYAWPLWCRNHVST